VDPEPIATKPFTRQEGRFGLNVRYNFGIRKKEETNIFNIESPDRQN
jgi:hypothetical protein